MNKPAVLCIDANVLKNLKNPTDIEEEDLAFINRKLVDAEDTTIGELFPQIIPVITLKTSDDKYLTYSRNGSESRLHGSRSISVGGHIDIEDYYIAAKDILDSIPFGGSREVYEEAGLKTYLELTDFTDVIYTPVDNVSKVHVGLFCELTVKRDSIYPDEELHDIQFLTKDQLVKNIEQYEHWSQHIIKNLI